MTLPTFKAAGTFTAGSGAITPPYPTGGGAPALNDIAILVVESENQAISLTTANGFVEMGAQANKAAGTAAVDPASRLAVYWKRCAGSDSAPVVAAPGNHATARIYLFSGCKTSGNPWNVYAEGNDGGANDLTGVIPGATTTVADCLIFLICTSSYNSTQTTEFGTTAFWANANLANIVERGDNTNTIGLGGGHGSATGEKEAAGAYVDTTVSLAHTSYKGAMSIALEPPSIIIEYGTATLTGVGLLTGVAMRVRVALAALAGAGTLTGFGYRIRTSAGVIAAVGLATAVAIRIGVGIAIATGLGTVSAVGAAIAAGVANLVGTGVATAKGIRLRVSAAALTGAGMVVTAGNRLRTATVALSGAGLVVAMGNVTRAGVGAVTGAGRVGAAWVRLRLSRAAAAGLGLATTTWTRIRFGGGIELGTGTVQAIGQVIEGGATEYGSATMSGVGTVQATGNVIEGGPSAVVVDIHSLSMTLLR
jgi:hypothetical protein